MKNATHKSIKELRRFGFLIFAASTVLAGFLLWRQIAAWRVFAGIAAIFIVLTILWPKVLSSIEKRWLQFGEKISIVISFLLLFMTFYAIITPMALILKVTRKDLLGLKLDQKTETYWLPVEKNGTATRYYTPY